MKKTMTFMFIINIRSTLRFEAVVPFLYKQIQRTWVRGRMVTAVCRTEFG